MTGEQPVGEKVELGAVSETALWTLHHRAAEARRPDALLNDPMAVELVDRIDYPFVERFGESRFQSRIQALRVRCFDREVEDFLARCPRGTVVCLGEGLETQFWRVDNGRAHWLTVDLPESVALRERLLPPGPRQRYLACSATDPAWLDEVDASRGLLITAQGLLMYLRPPEVRELIARCAERFPGAAMVFDTVPRWFGRLATQGRLRSHGYQAPPMPWGMDPRERPALASAHPAVSEIRDVLPPAVPGLLGTALTLASRVPLALSRRPSVVALRFSELRGEP